MGERKVLNKYIPPNFDPQLVPRSKKPKDDLIPVRMMLPFSIQCATCSSFLYRGRKFNSKKEPVKGINGKYLGIQRFRFYIKCSECSRPITFLTDPKNADYEMESGGTRNYEVWHDERETNQRFEEEAEEEEKMDGMKALENRVLESQREMAEMDALEEIRAMNARHVGLMKGKVGAALGLEALGGNKGDEEELELNENGLTREEEDLVKSIKFGAPLPSAGEDANSSDSVVIRRLDEEDEILAEKARQKEAEALLLQSSKSDNKRVGVSDENESREKRKMNVPVFKVKRKKQKDEIGSTKASNTSTTSSVSASSEKQKDKLETTKVTKTVTLKSSETPQPAQNSKTEDDDSSSDGGGGGGLGGLLGNYGSDDSD